MRTFSKFVTTFLAFIFSSSFLSAQNQTVVLPKIPIDAVTKLISYSEVVSQKGIKDTLYNRAIHWVNLNYKNPQSVTTVRDIQNGKIIGNHRFKVYNMPVKKDDIKTDGPVVEYTFTIELKENKYRIIITNLYTKNAGSKFLLERWLDSKDPAYQAAWDSYLEQVDTNIKDIIESLKKGMQETVKVSNDW